VPAAIHTGGAILLTDGTVQAPETATYLGAHSGDTRYAIGGRLGVADAWEAAAAKPRIASGVERVLPAVGGGGWGPSTA